MAKKIDRKKIKQVASKAKRVPRTDANTPGAEYYDGPANPVQEGTVVLSNGDGNDVSFSTEKPETIKKNAIERSKKVDLREEIRQIVAGFSTSIDARLQALSTRIEEQMQPLVRSVADIAVAKKELSDRLATFEDDLSVALNLNDELEPIDISEMFTGISITGDEMVDIELNPRSDDDGLSILAEASRDARDKDVATRSKETKSETETVN